MRRPGTTFSKAVVAIALASATGVQAQQPPTTAGTAQGTSVPARSKRTFSFTPRSRAKATPPAETQPDPMAHARGARQLLRNGEDYLTYGQYDRALDFLREAESRQFELTAAERKTLNTDILRAQRGVRGLDDPAAVATGRQALARRTAADPSTLASASTSASARPGSIVLSVPRTDERVLNDSQAFQLTSATREEPAASPAELALAEMPPAGNPSPTDLGPESLPPLPPSNSVAPSQAPAPLSAPAEPAAPASLAEAPAPAILPPDVPGTVADEPPALPPLSPPADVAPPAEMPLSEPSPEIAPAETASPAEVPLAEPMPEIAPVETAAPAETPLSDPLPEIAPVELPRPAEAVAPKPVAAELPPPIMLEEEESAPAPPLAEAPAPAPKTPAPKAAAKPVDEDPTALPPLVLDETPATATEPADVAPVDELKLPEDAPSPAEITEPAPAPAPVEPPLPEPVVRTAQSVPVADEPAPAPAPIADEPPAPEASEVDLPPLPEASAEAPAAESTATPSLAERATASLSEHKRPVLSEASKRRIEQIARRQQEDAARNPAQSIDAPMDNPLTSIDDLASNRLELPRAPSPTEIRPIRAIPIPEEFVPLAPRQWTASRKAWSAAATAHGPLYFQDAVLERYGQSAEHALGSKGRFLSYPLDDPRESNARNQILQPFYSIGLFASQVALWPYNLIVDPPWEAEYDLGYYRPGDRVPPDTIYLPLSGVGPPLRGRRY